MSTKAVSVTMLTIAAREERKLDTEGTEDTEVPAALVMWDPALAGF
jgi:hypothetical protein